MGAIWAKEDPQLAVWGRIEASIQVAGRDVPQHGMTGTWLNRTVPTRPYWFETQPQKLVSSMRLPMPYTELSTSGTHNCCVPCVCARAWWPVMIQALFVAADPAKFSPFWHHRVFWSHHWRVIAIARDVTWWHQLGLLTNCFWRRSCYLARQERWVPKHSCLQNETHSHSSQQKMDALLDRTLFETLASAQLPGKYVRNKLCKC